MDAFLVGLNQIFTFTTLIYMLAGSVAGIIAAAIPGFTVTMAIVLTLPLTFAMEPLQGIAVMLSVYVGGYTGGLISAALLGIPGTPSSVATTFDAFPMARRGEAGRALSLGVWASFFGTLVSTVVLIFAAPPLAIFAVRLGPWEYFSLIVFALTIVSSLVGSSVIRGMLAGLIGLAISTIGTDPIMGRTRFDFGIETLQAGLPFLVVLIGIFAISQLASEVEDAPSVRTGTSLVAGNIDFQTWKVMKEVLSRPGNLLRSSIVGVLIGALPGAGGSIANLVAYDQAKRASKTPEEFGRGIADGVVASEAGNSATAGGGLIPMIGLGIPGSAVDAILMASLMVHGISVGPRLMMDHADLVYGMFIAMAVASLMMLLVSIVSMRLFLRVAGLPKWGIVPVVMICCVVGSFALHNRVTDLYLLGFIGVAGYTLRALGYSLAPLVLGVILGPIAETNLRRALMTDGDPMLFVTRPVSLLFLTAAVLSIAWAIRSHLKKQKYYMEDSSDASTS
ncbi:tripartite tricarboxylate transporter permease [Breoghania sp.]|uniref:tripartite tricarboxylate transporter permease n=1 Tax=Breoghania sp. TaxID=2065378 RepID=UPI002AA617C0|nr:tripartite tricarboxylate transporter permease [Breoghania sp.]